MMKDLGVIISTSRLVTSTLFSLTHIQRAKRSTDNAYLVYSTYAKQCVNAKYLGPLANISAVDSGVPAPPDDCGGGSGAC